MDDDGRAGPDAPVIRPVYVTGGSGVQVGDHNIQVNFLFGGGRPAGPVVAGNVPQVPVAFQAREELMAGLRGAGPGASVVRAVTGMRGVGKTQLAAAYARARIDDGWRLVAWVNAEDTPAILNGLAVVADRLGMARPGRALEAVGGEVRNRLEADGQRCLLVFDNVTDPDEVLPYVPAAGQAQVVVTSTDATAAALGRAMPVDVFTERESLGFLADRTGRGDPEGAGRLAEELGHLPLALAQAAAVIAGQRLTYPAYLERLRSYPAAAYLPRVKGDPYPRGVAEAIGLSVDAVADADPAGLACHLLDVIALLAAPGVARELLYLGADAGAFTSGAEAVDAAAIDAAIGRLADASLVTFGGGDTVIAHRMTMRAVRERAERAGRGFVRAAQACLLLDAARQAQREPRLNRAEVRVFAQHVVALNAQVGSAVEGAPSAALGQALAERMLSLRVWALAFLNLAGDAVTQAVGIAEPLARDCAAALGESHPGTLSVRTQLGFAYRAAGRLDEAITEYERVLADRERQYGASHPDTLESVNNLGAAYDQSGRTAAAVELLERAVADRERLLGADDPITLTSRNNLATAYARAGRLPEAIEHQARSAADRERVLGAGHPDTLRSRNNLACVLQDAGRLTEALSLHERVAAEYERTLGPDHPETRTVRDNLAAAREQAAGGEIPPRSF